MIDHNIRRCYSSENLQVLLMTGPLLLVALAYQSVIKKLPGVCLRVDERGFGGWFIPL